MVAFPNTSAWYSYGIGIRARRERTAETTAEGSPVTFAATSTLRSTSSCTMASGSARTATVATSLRATCPPEGVSISMFPSSVRSLRTPDDHVEDLRLLVEVPDDQPRGERRRVPPDVAGPQPVPLRGREIDLHVHGWPLRYR